MEFENSELLKIAEVMPERLRRLINGNKWSKVSRTKHGYTFHILPDSPKERRTILVTGAVQCSVDKVLRAIFDDFETIPLWNHRARACKRLEVLDSNTDITYQIAKGVTGIISERDFIMLRRLAADEISSNGVRKSCILAMKSVDLPEYPETSGIVRADSGLCGWLLTEEEDGTTSFQCLIDADPKLRLWVPYKVLESLVIKDLTQGILGLESFLSE